MKNTAPLQELSENQEIELNLLSIFQRRIMICSHAGIISILLAGFFVWQFSITENNINIISWQILTISIFLIGYLIKYSFDKNPATSITAKCWHHIFMIYTTACGIGWGSGIAYIAWHTTGISIAMIAAILMSLCSVGVCLAMSNLHGVFLLTIATILPAAGGLLLKETSKEILVGTLLLLGMFLLLGVANTMHQNLRAYLRTEIQLRRAVNEAQLARAQADQANSFKSKFLANMSHEIRTPMNAVLGMLKLLQYTELNAQQSDYTYKGEGAAKAMLGLLNDILDFSKIEAGKVVLDLQPLHLVHFMQELMQLLQTYAAQKSVQLYLELDPALPQVILGDALRLRQVLVNLGGNAVKFTEQGTINLRIHLTQQVSNFATLRFEVQDSGIGIAPEKQSQIFEEFTQAENSTTRRFGGTGLGLSISKQLVRAMGGNIQLQSALGQGSTFTFELQVQTIHWDPSILEDDEDIYTPNIKTLSELQRQSPPIC